MDEKLENKLYDGFPYFVYSSGMTHSYVPLECGDGWFDVIWDMCEDIESYLEDKKEDIPFSITQLKEKWGQLVVYGVGGDSRTDLIIKFAEVKSKHICELCGRVGKLKSTGWYKVRCEECENVHPV